jgi:hypothetical protein
VDSWGDEKAIGGFWGWIYIKTRPIFDFSFVLIFEK